MSFRTVRFARHIRPGAVWRALAIPVLLASVASCTPRSAPAERPNIIFVVVDTLRRDHVAWYGPGQGVSPFLDSLAARSAVFSRAYATSSWTSPSITSMFTSRLQSQTGVLKWGSVLDASEHTLAEELQGAGYSTGGFTANSLMRAQFGYSQGFDTYNVYHRADAKVRASEVLRAGEKWMEDVRRDRPNAPFFLFLHLMEPHEPLQPPAEILAAVARARGAGEARVAELEQLARVGKGLAVTWTAPEQIGFVRDLYAAEVASLDAELARFFAALEAQRLLQKSVVVIVADHGEEFLEHGGVGHGRTLFEELIHIPFLLSLPGQNERVDVDEVVSMVDLAPTVLAAVGLPAAATFEGRSRLESLRPGFVHAWLERVRRWFGAPGQALSELAESENSVRPNLHRRALVGGWDKLVERSDAKFEAYDLESDPGEQHPEGLSRARTSELRTELDALAQRLDQRRSPAGTETLDEETRERMRALGYGKGP